VDRWKLVDPICSKIYFVQTAEFIAAQQNLVPLAYDHRLYARVMQVLPRFHKILLVHRKLLQATMSVRSELKFVVPGKRHAGHTIFVHQPIVPLQFPRAIDRKLFLLDENFQKFLPGTQILYK
jgi:hypothetical protein